MKKLLLIVEIIFVLTVLSFFNIIIKEKIYSKKQIRIAVIDTGYTSSVNSKVKLCQTGHRDFTGTGLQDRNGHGTHIANTIADNIDKNVDYCIVVLKWLNKQSTTNDGEAILSSLKSILDSNSIDVVNFSASGTWHSSEEREYLRIILNKDIKFFVAAGNDNLNLDKHCIIFPACYKLTKLNVVGNLSGNGIISADSNYGKIVTNWENGVNIIADAGYFGYVALSGTSQSTAIATAKMVNKLGSL